MKAVEMKDLSLENDDDELGDDFQDASMDTIGTGQLTINLLWTRVVEVVILQVIRSLPGWFFLP